MRINLNLKIKIPQLKYKNQQKELKAIKVQCKKFLFSKRIEKHKMDQSEALHSNGCIRGGKERKLPTKQSEKIFNTEKHKSPDLKSPARAKIKIGML